MTCPLWGGHGVRAALLKSPGLGRQREFQIPAAPPELLMPLPGPSCLSGKLPPSPSSFLLSALR